MLQDREARPCRRGRQAGRQVHRELKLTTVRREGQAHIVHPPDYQIKKQPPRRHGINNPHNANATITFTLLPSAGRSSNNMAGRNDANCYYNLRPRLLHRWYVALATFFWQSRGARFVQVLPRSTRLDGHRANLRRLNVAP